MAITAAQIKSLAQACGFELAGIAPALPTQDFTRFQSWRASGMAGEMTYLTDRRGDLRADPRNLLATAKSIVCVGKLYNTSYPQTLSDNSERGWISRYAWGADYHDVMRRQLDDLVKRIAEIHSDSFEWKICVDTAPLLERSFARAAGLGWIGRNTCLINQQQGSWFFLGELLLSIPLAIDMPPPDRCGTCRRCIDACPTSAIVPTQDNSWTVDSRLCISYLTIEKRGEIPATLTEGIQNHLFGCDICQDVCPWNSKAPSTAEETFGPTEFSPSLERFAELTEDQFRILFRKSAIWRTKYAGFLRNVAIAMGNSRNPEMRKPLSKLSAHSDPVVSRTAQQALVTLDKPSRSGAGSQRAAARLLGTLGCWFILALVLCFSVVRAASNADVVPLDPLANSGFVHFYNNEYDEALSCFGEQLKNHPDDPDLYNHVAQTLLYREMFRSGALESQLVSGSNPFLRRAKMEISAPDKSRFAYSISRSITLSESRLKTDPHDTAALYSLGVAHGLRANYLFLVEKAWMDSLREATAARKANQAILERNPNFIDARLILGLNQYVVGSLPFFMRALGFIGGFHGDREGGIRQLELVANRGLMNRYDAQILLAAIYRRERRPQQAIPLLEQLAVVFPRNYLLRLEQVQMYSDAGDKNSALRVLNQVEDLRRSEAPGYATLAPEKLAYLKGNLQFWYGDLDPALANLKKVTQKADDLDLNTAVMAWLRLGQVYDLRGDHDEAVLAYQEIVKTAPNSDIASEAKGYISSPYRRKRSNG